VRSAVDTALEIYHSARALLLDGGPLSEQITRCFGCLLAAKALGACPQLSQISDPVYVCTRYQVLLNSGKGLAQIHQALQAVRYQK